MREKHKAARQAYLYWIDNHKPKSGRLFDIMKESKKKFKHALRVLRSEIPSGMCAKIRTVAASNYRDHPTRSLYYCLFAPHTYIFVLRAHHVRGESHNQRNTTGEVATVDTKAKPSKILLKPVLYKLQSPTTLVSSPGRAPSKACPCTTCPQAGRWSPTVGRRRCWSSIFKAGEGDLWNAC